MQALDDADRREARRILTRPTDSPDPAGKASRKQWVFDVLYTKGKDGLVRARSVVRDQPAATARVLGRSAKVRTLYHYRGERSWRK